MIDFRRTYNYRSLGRFYMLAQKPTPPAKNEQGDFGKFTDFMRKLVAVPHSKIKAKLDAEKQEQKERKKRVFFRASHAKG